MLKLRNRKQFAKFQIIRDRTKNNLTFPIPLANRQNVCLQHAYPKSSISLTYKT